MKRYIQRNIETMIARKMIEHGVEREDVLTIDYVNEAYVVDIQKQS